MIPLLIASLLLGACGANNKNSNSLISENSSTGESEILSEESESVVSEESLSEEESESEFVSEEVESEIESESSSEEEPEPENVFKLVKDKNDLKPGDMFVIGCSLKGVLMSSKEASTNARNNYFEPIEYEIKDEIVPFDNLPDNALVLILGGYDGAWNFTDSEGKLLTATSEMKTTLSNEASNWTIDIANDGLAMITNTNSGYGTLKYNHISSRFTTYKNGYNQVELYRLESNIPIYPTSISLTGKEKVRIGNSVQFNVLFTPAFTNVRNVIWSSDNDEIASVDEKGLVTGNSEGTTNINVKVETQDGYLEESYEINVYELKGAKWTIMLYLCGSDLESEAYLATEDITELLSVNGQPEDVNFLVQTGGARKWSSKYGVSASKTGRYHVEDKKLIQDESLAKSNMGDPNTLESYVEWGLTNYPAENTGLILWNHGSALDGVCFDENYNDDSLTHDEVVEAIDEAFENTGTEKMTFIGYDACLMAVQDIAEFNSPYFDYMIASEEAELGEGWVYDEWLDDVYRDEDLDTIFKAMCDGFVNEYGSDQTMAYYNLNKMEDYRLEFEQLALNIEDKVKNNGNAFTSMMKGVKDYGDDPYYGSGYIYYGSFDVMDFLNKISANATFKEVATNVDAVKEKFNELVVYSRAGSRAGQSHGLTLICPINFSYVDYKSSLTHFTNWCRVVNYRK